MLAIRSPTRRPNLTSQIELVKNYHEHRKRLGVTRYKSPITLKKSLSFDQEKSMMFCELRSRKTYTNDFMRKEQSKRQEETDAIMLRKILEYDRKLFVFSLNQDPNSTPNAPSRLHHNSRVAQEKASTRIDAENQKIHFRITKAKSLYSKDQLTTFRQSPSARTFLMKREHSERRFPRNGSAQKMYTEQDVENQEEALISKIPQLSDARKIRDDVLRVDTSASRISRRPRPLPGNLFTLSSNVVCDRIRKERLASKLYERKVKFQNTIGSTFQRRKQR